MYCLSHRLVFLILCNLVLHHVSINMLLTSCYVTTMLKADLFVYLFVSVENTRIVSRNLGCKSTCDNNMNGNQVHVLIPEVIQVLSASSFFLF